MKALTHRRHCANPRCARRLTGPRDYCSRACRAEHTHTEGDR